MTDIKIDPEGYYLITSTWHDGRVSEWPVRGFRLPGWLKFERSLKFVSATEYRETTKECYDQWYYGELTDDVRQAKPVKKSPAKKAAAKKPAVKKPASKQAVKKATTQKVTKPKYSQDTGPVTKSQLKQIKKSVKSVAKTTTKTRAKKAK